MYQKQTFNFDGKTGRVTLRGENRPSIKATNWKEDGDYLIVPFRMLSASLITDYWIDFSAQGLLEKSVALFDNVTIYPDHYPSIERWLGVTTNARFSTDSIAGIESDFKIDTVKTPHVTRGLKMNPPAIKACSVGIAFDAKPSHDFGSKYKFYDRLGETVDGSVVRFIVTDILEVFEVSLVYAGADPNATALTKKNTINLTKKEDKKLIIVTNDQVTKLHLDPKDFNLTLSKEAELTDELAGNLISQAAEKVSAFEKKLVSEKQILEQALLKLGIRELSEIESLKEKLQISEKLLSKERELALKYYRQCNVNEVSPEIETLIQNSSYEQAIAFSTQYKKILENKYPKNEAGIRSSVPDTEALKTNKKLSDYKEI